MDFGYCRVSTKDQNIDRQIKALTDRGIDERNIFCDKGISGSKESRPELDKLLSTLRSGDTLTVLSFDRLARSTRQLLSLSERFEKEGIDLISIDDHIDTTTSTGKFMFTVLAAVAELERSIILERQAEGIAIAKEQGKFNGRPKVPKEKLDAAITLLMEDKKKSVREVAAIVGVSHTKIYQEMRTRGIER